MNAYLYCIYSLSIMYVCIYLYLFTNIGPTLDSEDICVFFGAHFLEKRHLHSHSLNIKIDVSYCLSSNISTLLSNNFLTILTAFVCLTFYVHLNK